jgi:hypothetical protein
VIKRWMERIIAAVIVLFVGVYGGDWAVYQLRGSPRSTVTVNRYVAIPLKGNKQEYDYLGSQETPCSVSLFSQGGLTPCRQLRRNPNQGMNIP